MPRVKLDRIANHEEYLVQDATKQLHGRLLAEGIHDTEVASWLGCSSQNVSSHFRNCTFSYRQVLIIEDNLKRKENRNEKR